MKQSLTLFILFTFLTSLNSFSQEKEKPSLNKGTIESQFNFVINKSNSYQDNKVIKKSWIYTLKSHVSDSLQKEKNTIKESKIIIAKQNKDFTSLQNELASVNKNLEEVSNAKDSIRFLGISLKKDLFKTVIGLLIGVLFFALLYTIYLFKNSNRVTKKIQTEYTDLEAEYNTSRTRALEREQALNRKLQDEINKQK